MGFREWLRGLLEKGVFVSQGEIARKLGKSEGAVSMWLSGERHPELESCSRISEAAGVPLADIVEMVRRDARETSAVA